jgi:hypothetical protein
MGTPAAASQSSSKNSRHERNTKLMRALGAEFYDPVPRDQLLTFMLPIYETPRRILAWVHERTVCYPVSSAFCIDNNGNVLQQKDCLKSLNAVAVQFAEKHGTAPVVLDKSAISRGFDHLKRYGLVRFADQQGPIHLCGKVTPTPEACKPSDEKSICPALQQLLEQCSVNERTTIIRGLLDREAQLDKAEADAVRPIRQLHAQARRDFLAEHGIVKVGKKYERSAVRTTPPMLNQQFTGKKLHVLATGESANAAEKLHVSATSEPEVSAEDPPAAPTPQGSAGTDRTQQPTAAVPTFQEWKHVYPAERLDEQKADQIIKALSDADKIKATDGLRSHRGCERWRRTPDYIPFASKFLRERYYDYAPAPYFELKTVKSFPMKNGSDGSTTVPTAEQVRNFLIANAREVGAVAGFRELAETLESLAADVDQQYSDLEHLEKLLNELEVTMVAALKSAQTEEQLAAVKRDLKDQLQPHRLR